MKKDPTNDTNAPIITIIIVPREKFSLTQRNLESILETADIPFDLVYVDGNSPPKTKRYIQNQAEKHAFKVVRKNHYLPSNKSRNVGLSGVTTKYIVFIDNDVICKNGWLSKLVHCAEKNDAGAVTPIICEGQNPLHSVIHSAGGTIDIVENSIDDRILRDVHESMHGHGKKVDSIAAFKTQTTGLVEFHCVLIKNDVLKSIGGLDEGFLNTRDHIDLCMSLADKKIPIYIEPDSIVTYIHDSPLTLSDIPFYMIRWNDKWAKKSIEHFCNKWQLNSDSPRIKSMSRVSWRYKNSIIIPFMKKTLLFKIKQTKLFPKLEYVLLKIAKGAANIMLFYNSKKMR